MQYNFNISPSSLNLWLSSPLQFYYQYIVKAAPDINLNQVYSQSGNCTHESLEKYSETKDKEQVRQFFNKRWEEFELHKNTGFAGRLLSKQQYWECVEYGMERMDTDIKVEKSELRLEFPVCDGVMKKGFLDILGEVDGKKEIIDWKTSSSMNGDEERFRIQTMFYSHLYWCETGEFIEQARIVYLKLKKDKVYNFTIDEIVNFQKNHIDPMLQMIRNYGMNEFAYPIGEWDLPFNAHINKCKEQQRLRSSGDNIIIYRRDNRMYFPNGLPNQLVAIIDKLFSYKKQGAQWSDAYKRGQWDGRIKFLRKDSLPWAFIHKFIELLDAYNKRAGTAFKPMIVDQRDKNVVDMVYDTKFRESKFILRDYQNEAVEMMLKKRIMIMHGGVGSGKSLIIAEFLRRVNRRSLVLINKIELVHQLADEIEEHLGVKVGRMVEGSMDVDKQITVATPQTIAAIIKRNNQDTINLKIFLYNITAIVYDESHLCFDNGQYQMIGRMVHNIEFSIGLSGSPFRNNNDTLEMNALVGFVEFKKDTKELQEEGYVVPVKVKFITVPDIGIMETDDYHEQYRSNIVQNEYRNKIIVDVVKKYRDKKKILVLVNRIEHGEMLNELIPDSFFLHGSVDSDMRKEKLDEFKGDSPMVLIGMMKIMGVGMNIPSLDIIINAAAQSSHTDTVQSIGRACRLSDGKKQAYMIDFFDESPMFKAASRKRMKYLRAEGYEVSV